MNVFKRFYTLIDLYFSEILQIVLERNAIIYLNDLFTEIKQATTHDNLILINWV